MKENKHRHDMIIKVFIKGFTEGFPTISCCCSTKASHDTRKTEAKVRVEENKR